MKRTAVCPGSFDPPTLGHINIIRRGLHLFDHVHVAVLNNTSKRPLFAPDERVAMFEAIFRKEPRISVGTFEGLLVDYLRKKGERIILKGLRTIEDFQHEIQMSLANRHMDPGVETAFVMTEGDYSFFSSTLIKEIALLGGSVHGLVPPLVEKRLKERIAERMRRIDD